MNRPCVSFDVFDTVLTRTCAEPHDLFVEVGARLHSTGLYSGDPGTFAEKRRFAEGAARREDPQGEPLLADIYSHLGRLLGWNETQQTAAIAEELAVETAGIRAVPGMLAEVARARRTAGRVVFISDNYLPSETVRHWLERNGFWQPGDLLFISAEHKASKGRDGALFRVVHQQLGVDWGDWVHRGDNPDSDAKQPHRLGISAELRDGARLTGHEHHLRGSSPFAPVWRSRLAGAARLARLDSPVAGTEARERVLWDVSADIAGPLFYGFTDWCLAESERRGVKDLYFLARGGQILLRIAEKIQAVRPRAIRLHYLPASRLAFGTATHGSESDQASTERKRLARGFLAQEGLANNPHAAIVDTGWHGTIQLGLETLLGGTNSQPVPGFYLGLIDHRPASAGWQAGYTNTFAPLPFGFELAFCILIELLARANHGLVVGFAEDKTGRISPRLDHQDQAVAEEIRLCQRAILACADHALANRESIAPANHAELAQVVVDGLCRFHDHPTADEARVFGYLPHANQASGRFHETLCVAPTTATVVRAMLHRKQRPVGWWLPAQTALGQASLLLPYCVLRKIKRTAKTPFQSRD